MYKPTNIYYMITIECNQKCTKCSHWKHNDKAERLQPGKIITCIRSIQSGKELCIVGGEPLLFKLEILEILMGVAETGIRTVIIIYHNINGTLNGRQLKNSEGLLYGTTANLAITRRVAEKIDFNEKFPIAAGEDIEFCFRANNLGFSIKHVPTMVVYHNYGYTGHLINDLKRFRSQFRKYGLGEKVLIKEIPNYYVYFDRTVEIPVMCTLHK